MAAPVAFVALVAVNVTNRFDGTVFGGVYTVEELVTGVVVPVPVPLKAQLTDVFAVPVTIVWKVCDELLPITADAVEGVTMTVDGNASMAVDVPPPGAGFVTVSGMETVPVGTETTAVICVDEMELTVSGVAPDVTSELSSLPEL